LNFDRISQWSNNAFLNEPSERVWKQMALKIFLAITIIIMFPFALVNAFYFHLIPLAIFEFGVGVFSVGMFFMTRNSRQYQLVSYMYVALAAIVMLTILLHLQTEESTLIWLGIFPVIAYSLLGCRKGAIAHTLFSVALIASLLFGWYAIPYAPSAITLANVVGTAFAYGVFIYLYEFSKNEAIQRYYRRSFVDELTSTGNRKMFTAILEKSKALARRGQKSLSLIMIDIDHFKQINDTHGHVVGDLVLVEFARLLSDNIRSSDTLSRWGGEEFAIILPETNQCQAIVLAEKLRKIIQEYPFSIVGSLTASFGVTEVLTDELDEESIRHADRALYRAKENGRNRVESHQTPDDPASQTQAPSSDTPQS